MLIQANGPRKQNGLLGCVLGLFTLGILVFPTPGNAQIPPAAQKQLGTYYSHSLAVKPDGTVWAWGDNGSGQLGNGGYVFSDSPGQVAGITGVTKVAAGRLHSLAMTNTGDVYSWGDNTSGQLGSVAATPVQANLVASGMVDIAAGYAHSVAVDANGKVWLWGANADLQLGTTAYPTTEPFKHPDLADAIACAAGESHTLILKSDGTVWAAGSNAYGQASHDNNVFTQVPGLPFVIAISAGYLHSCALASDGTVWVWGYRQWGQGDNISTPMQVPGLSSIAAIQVGGYDKNIAIKSDGTVLQWGMIDPHVATRTPPQVVEGISSPASVAVGRFHCIVAMADGTVQGWGFNGYGLAGFLSMSDLGFDVDDMIGYSTLTHENPIQITGLEGVKSIAQSIGATIVLRTDGTVCSWGANTFYDMGIGGDGGRPIPTQISGISSIDQIAAGTTHCLALGSNGRVHSWGLGEHGELGNDDLLLSPSPTILDGIINVKEICAEGVTSMALKSDGTVWWWGSMGEYPSAEVSSTPQHMPSLGSSNVAIGAGDGFGVALKSDGTVWSWGRNNLGQLGDGTLTASSLPVKAQLPEGKAAVQISVSSGQVICKTSDGGLYGWGSNYHGAIDAGTYDVITLPREIAGGDGVEMIIPRSSSAFALLKSGKLVRWGRDANLDQNAEPIERGVVGVFGGLDTYLLKENGTVSVIGNAYGNGADGPTGHLSEGINPWQTAPKPMLGFNLLLPAPLLTRSSPVGNTTVLPLGSTLQLEYLWNTASSSSRSLTLSHYGRELSTVSGVNPVLSFTPTTWGSFPLNVYGKDSNGAYSIRSSAGTVVVPYDSEYPNGDGLPDWWEILHIGNLSQNGSDSSDGDTLSNKWEFLLKSNPNLQDTDGDGIPDDRDSRPNDPAHGQLNISITFPVNGTQVP